MFPSILIVDDEPSILKSLSGLLSDEGFEVQTATNGYEALKKRKVIVVPGYRNKILAFMATVVPRAFAIKITRWLMERI